MTENLLDDNNQEDLLPVDPAKDYFTELVGENKKFKDAKDLARGKYEADQYVELLKRRQDELRADYLKLREENTTRATLKDMIDQLQSKQNISSNENTPVTETNQPKFDPKEVETLFDTKLLQYETQKKQTENFNMVKEKLQQRFGENYQTAVKQQISDLGITTADLEDMARTKPKALIRALGLDQPQSTESFNSPPRSSQRSDSFAPTGAKSRTWAYYQEMKKTDPVKYHDRKTAIQMQQDAIDLGEKFRDGDYFVKGLHEQ